MSNFQSKDHQVDTTTTNNRITTYPLGCVKWFNTKIGYGFITDLDTSDEVFVHHSSIRSESDSFKYLVQGEYVQYQVSLVGTNTHAVDVTGVRGGKLMCDVHQERQAYSTAYPRPVQSTQSYGRGPPDTSYGYSSAPERTRRHGGGGGGRSGKERDGCCDREYRAPPTNTQKPSKSPAYGHDTYSRETSCCGKSCLCEKGKCSCEPEKCACDIPSNSTTPTVLPSPRMPKSKVANFTK
jgi:CspA family cold shock protein